MNPSSPKEPKFQTLSEAFGEFKHSALSPFTPRASLEAIEGGFFAGAQAVLVLIQERAQDSDLTEQEAGEYLRLLNSECVAHFLTLKAQKGRKS
jgi:hypothetical protein